MVKCNEIKEHKEYGKTLSTCKGKGMVLRMVESGIIGLEAGLHVKKEGNFRGAAVEFDRIKLSAQSAEQAANQHMRYRSSVFDNYTYDLKIDQFSNRPVWIIKKACGSRGVFGEEMQTQRPLDRQSRRRNRRNYPINRLTMMRKKRENVL